ncbi:hypothetical protein CRENBAI_005590 [Crenichthys baileyi]|uniref:Fas apoptotic inhibitory molecule 1 n=1 Tax=Crenichthys baileyi TaxID=28760 RepID=A0AAV9S7Y1_9TELE
MQLLLRRQDPVPSAFQLLRTSSAESRMVCGDVVAVWEVALSDGVYRIEFAHGTTTGKRVVYVNGTEVLRKDWMFKLVGKETFTVGRANTKATINIEAISGFAYEYSLNVDGKSLQKFIDNRAKTTKTWVVQVDGTDYRVVLEKDTMDVWCNGQKMDTTGEFVDDGTETHFLVGDHDCCIKAMNGGKKKNGIVHCLLLDGEKVPAPTQPNRISFYGQVQFDRPGGNPGWDIEASTRVDSPGSSGTSRWVHSLRLKPNRGGSPEPFNRKETKQGAGILTTNADRLPSANLRLISCMLSVDTQPPFNPARSGRIWGSGAPPHPAHLSPQRSWEAGSPEEKQPSPDCSRHRWRGSGSHSPGM